MKSPISGYPASHTLLWPLTLLCILAACIAISSCGRNAFELNFDLSVDSNTAYTVAYLASNSTQNVYRETAVSVSKGKGGAVFASYNPTLVKLSSGASTIWIYAERGDKINITGPGDNLLEWQVGGDKINRRWSDWRIANRQALASGNTEKINAAVAAYVKAHPDDPLSTLLLELHYNRRGDNAGFLSLWKLLRDEAARESWITLVGRNDLYTNMPLPAPDFRKSHRLVLKSRANGADTVTTGAVPVVLYFWRTGDKGRNEAIDSLKRLRKENPDSAKFIIADVCFDPDSISWIMPLSRDSLEHTIRAWNPLAEVDSAMRALGIERTPAMIRIDPVTKQK